MFRPKYIEAVFSYTAYINNFKIPLVAPKQIPTSDEPSYINKPFLQYSDKLLSGIVPSQYLKGFPVIKIIRNDGKIAKTSTLDIDAPSKQVLINIEIGMLTPPRNVDTWIKDLARMALDFFQKIPISELTIAQYIPVYLKKITLPNGTIYTDHSNDTGGVYSGDLREEIGKSLIATGIRMANIGINDTAGTSQKQHLAFKQTVVQTSVGKYKNGVIVHGLSGGGGQITLESTTGNEFTHELGHDYGLPHYPGGTQSIQSLAAGWGYDAFRNKMLADVIGGKNGNACIPNEQCTAPFENLYQFNTDAMAGGEMSNGAISLFTQYTPYSAKIIQDNLQRIPNLDPLSSSGYSLWNKNDRKMEPDLSINYPKPPVMTLVGYYDLEGKITGQIYPPMYSNWENVFKPNIQKNSNCHLNMFTENGDSISYPLDDKRINANEMNKFHINFSRTKKYKKPEIVCKVNGKNQYLLEKLLANNNINLPAPTVVGGQNGYSTAVLNLKNIRAYFNTEKAFNLIDFEHRLEAIYGPLHSYKSNTYINIAKLYKDDNNNYYQSKLSGNNLHSPLQADPAEWRYLGNSIPYIQNLDPPSIIFKKDQDHFSAINIDLEKLRNAIDSSGSGQRLAFTINMDKNVMLSGPIDYTWNSTKPNVSNTSLIESLDDKKQKISFRVWNGTYFMNSLANWYISQDDLRLQLANPELLPKGKINGKLYLIAYWWNGSKYYPLEIECTINN